MDVTKCSQKPRQTGTRLLAVSQSLAEDSSRPISSQCVTDGYLLHILSVVFIRPSPDCQRRREDASPWRSKDASGGVMTRAPRGALVIWRSACLRLAVVGPGRASTVLALPEPIALTVHLEDVDVMGEAVEERSGRAARSLGHGFGHGLFDGAVDRLDR